MGRACGRRGGEGGESRGSWWVGSGGGEAGGAAAGSGGGLKRAGARAERGEGGRVADVGRVNVGGRKTKGGSRRECTTRWGRLVGPIRAGVNSANVCQQRRPRSVQDCARRRLAKFCSFAVLRLKRLAVILLRCRVHARHPPPPLVRPGPALPFASSSCAAPPCQLLQSSSGNAARGSNRPPSVSMWDPSLKCEPSGRLIASFASGGLRVLSNISSSPPPVSDGTPWRGCPAGLRGRLVYPHAEVFQRSSKLECAGQGALNG